MFVSSQAVPDLQQSLQNNSSWYDTQVINTITKLVAQLVDGVAKYLVGTDVLKSMDINDCQSSAEKATPREILIMQKDDPDNKVLQLNSGVPLIMDIDDSQDSIEEFTSRERLIVQQALQELMQDRRSETVVFPKKEELLVCLKEHPLTNNPYLNEKKIVNAVADYFGGSEKVPMGIKMGVMLTMHDLNKKLGWMEMGVHLTSMVLEDALMDCAHKERSQGG